MINWMITKENLQKIGKICDRDRAKIERPRMDLIMDLSATHSNGCPLDFDKLLGFDDFDFYHDIYGIVKHLDRTTGKLQNCFLPRCAC